MKEIIERKRNWKRYLHHKATVETVLYLPPALSGNENRSTTDHSRDIKPKKIFQSSWLTAKPCVRRRTVIGEHARAALAFPHK